MAEIAKAIGIETVQLAKALKKPGAPKPKMNGAQKGHRKLGDWYEPIEVRNWYAKYSLNDPAAAHREYNHASYEKRKEAA